MGAVESGVDLGESGGAIGAPRYAAFLVSVSSLACRDAYSAPIVPPARVLESMRIANRSV